jgi:uncharacterized membrane protein YfcA
MIGEWVLYLAFGSLAGILSGLFGIGGGVVIVPFLVWLFARQGFVGDSIMVMAVATSLATIIVTSISAVRAHHRRGAIHWGTVFRLAPGILAGSVGGSIIAHHLPVQWFKLIFALFLLYVAGRMLLDGKMDQSAGRAPKAWLFALAGSLIGAVSAILGIGGGTLSVPFLVKCRYPIRNAVAISAACGFPIALAGTATYVALGWRGASLPAWSLGYVYLPAFVGIILTSVPFAPLGAYLAHHWPTARLRRIFAFVVAAVGGKLLWQAAGPGLGLFYGLH